MIASLGVLSFLLSPQSAVLPSAPQTLFLSTSTYHSDRPGGRSSWSGKALTPNRTTAFITYASPGQCGFSAGGFTEFAPSTILGWEVVAVPKLVRPEFVELSVTWSRRRNHVVEARGALDVLLRPGDSIPLDVSETSELRSGACRMTSAEVKLELDPADFWKISADRASVFSTDLWLVHKPANGREQLEQVNVRGALNEEVPFYFDAVKIGTSTVAVLGTVRARLNDVGTVTLEFSAERQMRIAPATIQRGFMPDKPDAHTLRFNSPDEVVSVEFPGLAGDSAGDLWSIRIKTRRLR